MDMYTLLFLKWITNKDLLYSTGNSAQCYVAAWVGGEFGGEWIRVCVAESLRCPPETITALLIGCTPIQNKELKKKYNRLDGFTTEVDVSQSGAKSPRLDFSETSPVGLQVAPFRWPPSCCLLPWPSLCAHCWHLSLL